MIRLALLLLGARALRSLWPLLVLMGALWCGLSLWLLANLHSPDVVYVEDVLAAFLALEGTVHVLAAVILGFRRHVGELVRGLSFLLAAFLIFNVEWDHNLGATVVFGTAFLVDGLLKAGSAYVLRGEPLIANLSRALFSVVMAIVIFTRWPLPHEVTVPFCLALLFLFSGIALLRAGLQLRRLPLGGSITGLPVYAAINWQARGIAVPPVAAESPRTGQTLHVRIWTAMGSAADPQRRFLVDRYVAAVDRKGVVSTGHSAMELPPDLYISHYPGVEIDHRPDELRSILHAGPRNDVKGRFQPSLAYEISQWCQPDQTVTFHRFNDAALRAFWQLYSRDDTYNLTARNCSTTVILALDAATEGLASTGRPLRDFLRLTFNPDFWMLRLVRGRAESMTWTPGLVLDYARLLNQVLEHGQQRWRDTLGAALSSDGASDDR